MMASSNLFNKSQGKAVEDMNSIGYKSRWMRVCVVSALTLAITACHTIPSLQTDPVVARPNIPLNENGGYEVYGDNKVPSSLAAVRWQSFYTDSKLKSLIQLGLENNKDVKQAVLAIQKAKAQYRITDNKDLPILSGSGEYSRSSNYNPQANKRMTSDNYSVGLGMAGYELDFWGKISSLKDQALQNYLATAAARDTAQVSLIANIAKSYVNLSYQLKQLELASKTLASREESLRITTARLNAGIDSKAPSLQAEASVETARIAVLNAQSGVLKAKNALKYLVGAPITDNMLPDPAVSSIATTQVLSAGLPSELLLYRPDVLQAEYQLKAAGANIDVARASYYPSISLTGRFGYSSSDLSDLFKSSAAGWSFGPSVSVPIFDAGQLDANYEVAEIEREQALANYENAIESAFREVSDVLAERATLDARTESQYRLQKSYDEIFNISEARYIAQIDDYLSVLDAQRSLFSTQQTILNLEQERLNNQIDLYQALGGGANLIDNNAIPTPRHRNLTNIVSVKSNEQKAVQAIKAASAPVLVSEAEANALQNGRSKTVIKRRVVDSVDLDNDKKPDALITETETTTQQDDLQPDSGNSADSIDGSTNDNSTSLITP